MSALDGRRIVVTGASRGIGRAVVHELASQGAAVAIVARHRPPLAALQSEIPNAARVEVLCCDVSSGEEVEVMAGAVVSRLGGVDGVVNCAGIGPRATSFASLADDAYRSSFEVNVLGAVRVIRALLSELRQYPSAAVVNVASMAGRIGVPMWAEYCASKHALLGVTKSFAREYALEGIRCNAVCPGFTEGGLLSESFLQRWADSLGMDSRQLARDVIKRRTPIGRFVQPQVVASTVAFLIGPSSLDITGQAFNVCGGIGDS
ncbi:MAG TPA: SDR family oxidoreductase [Polyangiaceae bacterium]|nr:SDR family oxidoreductase [Polyangiaceae bacterium]